MPSGTISPIWLRPSQVAFTAVPVPENVRTALPPESRTTSVQPVRFRSPTAPERAVVVGTVELVPGAITGNWLASEAAGDVLSTVTVIAAVVPVLPHSSTNVAVAVYWPS